MTLVVAYVTSAGAVMASDSHAAEEDATAATAEKIWASGGLLFSYSGHLSVRDKLRAAIEGQLVQAPLTPPVDVEMAASRLSAIARPVLEEVYANFVPAPGENAKDALGGALLVIGSDGEKYWLLEIDRDGTQSFYTAEGFHTIGSGAFAGHVVRRLLAHYALPGHECQHLRLLAYRHVTTCIEVLGGAYGLGGPVQLWQSTEGGYAEVTGDELEAVKEGVEQWVSIEQESLRKVFAVEEPAEAEPLPEELESPEPSP